MNYAKQLIDPLVGTQVTVVCTSPTEVGRKIHTTGILHRTAEGEYYIYLGLPGDADQVKSFGLAEVQNLKPRDEHEDTVIFLP